MIKKLLLVCFAVGLCGSAQGADSEKALLDYFRAEGGHKKRFSPSWYDGSVLFSELADGDYDSRILASGENHRGYERFRDQGAERLRELQRADLIPAWKKYAEKRFLPLFLQGEKENPSECSKIDLRSTIRRPAPRQRSQEDTNWCCLFSAADLLRRETGFTVSVLDLAVRYYRRYPKFIPRGTNALHGSMCHTSDVLSMALEEGVCPEKHAQDIASVFTCDSFLGDRRGSLWHLRAFSRELTDSVLNEPGQADEILKQIFPTLTAEDRRQGIAARFRDEGVAADLVDRACKDRIKLTRKLRVQVRLRDKAKPTALIKAVDDQLEARRFIEVGVPISANSALAPAHGLMHSMTVVGRFTDPQTRECTYILRDSDWKERVQAPPNDFFRMDGSYTLITRTNLMRAAKQATFLQRAN